MPLVSDLTPSIRLNSDMPTDVSVNHEDIEIPDVEPEVGDGMTLEHDDGSITISLDGKPLVDSQKKADLAWFDNLVDEIDSDELNRIADDLLRGVDDDLASRSEWIDTRAQGIKLLGLKIEIPGISGASDGSTVEGISKVRHPLLQEACLRFQANARSEMLPTDGPVKIRDDSNGTTFQRDEIADALQKDFNHYLTVTAKEYYPDTDRMFLMLGFGGSAFKKVYFCPLRNRPVSESVDADDLIVNSSANDLSSAKRITHRVMMKSSTVKRLQILGVYRDIDLSDARLPSLDAVQEAKNAQQGITQEASLAENRDREIYEIYCELDIRGFEHKLRGKETGLEIPYRVTIDVSSREILSIVRNYDRDTEDLPEARDTFVEYVFVPGFGFYGIGLLHILGNTTNAVTAAWRELLDAGMYANFPGFLYSDVGARQNSTLIRVPPGGGAQVKTGGMPINNVVMPLPYKEPSQALMALTENIAQTGMRVGGTSELMVGEGRQDAPVGTTLAMIEQATKVLNSVHKRMHSAQAQEFQLLKRCFSEHPESFWGRNKRPAYNWDEDTLLKALEDADFVPQADPNTASHAQRIMKVMALKQLQGSNPSMYDAVAVDTAALRAMGWSNPEQFMLPEGQRNQPTPELIKGMEDLRIAKQEADAKTLTAQAAMAKVQQVAPTPTGDPLKAQELQLKARDMDLKHQQALMAFQRDKMSDDSRDQDRMAELQMEMARMRQADQHHSEQLLHDRQQAIRQQMHDRVSNVLDLARQIEATKGRVK